MNRVKIVPLYVQILPDYRVGFANNLYKHSMFSPNTGRIVKRVSARNLHHVIRKGSRDSVCRDIEPHDIYIFTELL